MTENDIKVISELYKDEKEPLYEKLKDVIPALIELNYKKRGKKSLIRKRKTNKTKEKSQHHC